LTPEDPATVRFLFGGDVSFGRRFIDPGETAGRDQVPADDPDALILVSDPLPGSKACVDWVRPYFQAVDFGVVNFESPVTDDPSTPHPDKDFVFFTLLPRGGLRQPGQQPRLRLSRCWPSRTPPTRSSSMVSRAATRRVGRRSRDEIRGLLGTRCLSPSL
jgi:hypothetical protein